MSMHSNRLKQGYDGILARQILSILLLNICRNDEIIEDVPVQRHVRLLNLLHDIIEMCLLSTWVFVTGVIALYILYKW